MKVYFYLVVVLGIWMLAILETTAQIGVINLDTVLKYHPQTYVINSQIRKEATFYEDTIQRLVDCFIYKISNPGSHYDSLENTKLIIIQEEIQAVQKRAQLELEESYKSKMDSLNCLIQKEAHEFAILYKLTDLIQQDALLFASARVKDYTTDFLLFVNTKWDYQLKKNRLTRKQR
ncbi:hypothetical protein QNI16_21465 [Cytophagaceae bacterium YF14B1]|uniref:Uncharacterized protein n=1 Tax=Xanthocytophaga flava TaxID=3048013 RepID=A0AAE3QPJ3_9BACT|nr:hypothetical protein [Xanthocytophaga flavus]MDJ1483082.1 hypothetical protein [Xanthocytophaga flavus]